MSGTGLFLPTVVCVVVLNINLFKKLIVEMKDWSDKGVQTDLALIGSKATSFFSSVGGNVVAQVTGMGDDPSLADLIGSVKVMLQAYDEGRLDKLYIVSNRFVNTMSQVPTIVQVLPLPPSDDENLKKKTGIIYTNLILKRYWIPFTALHRSAGIPGRCGKPGQ